MVRAMTAYLTGIPQSDIRAIPAEIGGGFGGKTIVYLEPLATLLAKKSGRPVKMVMTREEVMRATGPDLGLEEHGQDRREEGRHDRRRAGHLLSAGRRVAGLADPRRGRLQLFALRHPERAVGRLRRALQPLQGRGLSRAGRADRRLCGGMRARRTRRSAEDGSAGAAAEERREAGHQGRARPGLSAHRLYRDAGGREGASALQGAARQAAGQGRRLRLLVQRRRRILARRSTSPRTATSSSPRAIPISAARAPAIANICAELLGIDYRRVSVLIGDTATVGFSNLTGGSRVLFASAMVVTQSTEKIITTLRERAAKIWEIDPEAVKWENGAAHPVEPQRRPVRAADAGRACRRRRPQMGGPIGAGVQLNTEGAEGGFGTHICDVEVDVELGIVRVIRYTAVQDVGRAIHPGYVEGQMQGGVAQGIGWALNEEYIYNKDGKVDNPGFLDYRMPVCSDLPMLDTRHGRSAEPETSARRQGRRRSAAGAGDGRGRQRRPQRARQALLQPADVAAEGAGGAGGEGVSGPAIARRGDFRPRASALIESNRNSDSFLTRFLHANRYPPRISPGRLSPKALTRRRQILRDRYNLMML